MRKMKIKLRIVSVSLSLVMVLTTLFAAPLTTFATEVDGAVPAGAAEGIGQPGETGAAEESATGQPGEPDSADGSGTLPASPSVSASPGEEPAGAGAGAPAEAAPGSLIEYGEEQSSAEIEAIAGASVSRDTLGALVAKAEIIAGADRGLFVPEVFADFTAALEAAKELLADEAAAQEAIDAAVSELDTAIDTVTVGGLAQPEDSGSAKATLSDSEEAGRAGILTPYLREAVTLEKIEGVLYATLTFATGEQILDVSGLSGVNTYEPDAEGAEEVRYYGLPINIDAEGKTYTVKLRLPAGEEEDSLIDLAIPAIEAEFSGRLSLSEVSWASASTGSPIFTMEADKTQLAITIAKAEALLKIDASLFQAAPRAVVNSRLAACRVHFANVNASQDLVDSITADTNGVIQACLDAEPPFAAKIGTAQVAALHRANDETPTMLAPYLTPDAELYYIDGNVFATLTFATGEGAADVSGLNDLNTYAAANDVTRYYGRPLVIDTEAKTYTIKIRLPDGAEADNFLELKMPPMPTAQTVRLRFSDVEWGANIPDINLKKAILDELGIPYANDEEARDATVNEPMIAGLTELDASNRGITDLTSIGMFTNLRTLDLSGNPLTYRCVGLEELSKLTALVNLDLSACDLAPDYMAEYTWNTLQTPWLLTGGGGIPNAVQSAIVGMPQLETLDLSDNGLFHYTELDGAIYPSLRVLDLSNSGVARLMLNNASFPVLERFDVSGGYYWADEDNVGFEELINTGIDKFVLDSDKSFSDLYSVQVVKPNAGFPLGSQVATWILKRIQIAEGDYEVDLGDVPPMLRLGFSSYVSANTTFSVDSGLSGDTHTISNIQGNKVRYLIMENLAPGEQSIDVTITHLGGDSSVYTFTFNVLPVPTSAEPTSAGITDAALQYIVCDKLAAKPDPNTHVVTKTEMASLTGTLDIAGVRDLSGIEYLSALTTLNINDGAYTGIPDLGATGIKTLKITGSALENLPASGELPPGLTSFTLVAPRVTAVPDLDTFASLATVNISGTPLLGALPALPEASLTTLTLANLPSLTALPALPETKLATLSLTDFPNLTALPALPPKVASLTLSALPQVDELPANVGALKLTTLTVSNTGIADFSGTAAITTKFNLSYTAPAGAAPVTGLAGNPAIKGITLTGSVVFGEEGDAPLPFLTSFTAQNGAISELPAWLGGSPVATLNLRNTPFASMPAVVGEMTALTSLNMEFCGLSVIDVDLSALTALRTVNLASSQLSSLPPALEDLVAVTSLNISSNKISDMGSADLSRLTALQTLDISKNRISVLPDIRPLTNLRTFNADGNKYIDLPTDYFGSLDKIIGVKLGDAMVVLPNATAAGAVPRPGTGAETAINALKANNPSLSASAISIYGYAYAALESLVTDHGSINIDVSTGMGSSEGFLRNVALSVPGGTSSVTFTPSVLNSDTVVSVYGEVVPPGSSYTFEGLSTGDNFLTIKAESPNITTTNSRNICIYRVNVTVGSPLPPGTEIEEGKVYLVDYTIFKRDTDTASMANGYFTHKAKTVKNSDGSYTVDITTTSASDIPQMRYQIAESYAAAVANNVWTPSVRHSLTSGNTVSFRLEMDSLDDRVYLKPKVAPMGGGEPECRLQLNPALLYEVTDEVAGLDTVALEGAIAAGGEQLEKRNIFTTATWNAFTAALDEAEEILEAAADDLCTQQEIDDAAAALIAAMTDLEVDPAKLANKTALSSAIVSAKTLTMGNHTQAAWNALQEAVAQAEGVRDDDYASQSEVTIVLAALNTAVTLFNNSGEASQLDKDNLADGVYSVHIDMIKSADHASKSMADGAVNHTAKITVVNGVYYATLEFVGMTINLGGNDMFGYLQRLKYYDSGYTWTWGEPVGNLLPATVDELHLNGDGSVLTDYYNDASNPYPKKLTFPLVNKAAYQDDDVPLQVFVPIMETIAAGNGTQNVLMRVDWTTLTLVSGGGTPPPQPPTPPVTNKAALAAKLSEARGIGRGDWTDVSWDTLQTAIANAQGVHSSVWSEQSEIDAHVGYLHSAIAGLSARPSDGGGTAGSGGALADGKYKLRVDLWHYTQNRASMGNDALNHTALLEVIGGKYYLTVSGHQMQVGNIVASLLYMQIRQPNGSYVNASVVANNLPGGKPSAFRFALASRDTYVYVKVDPQVEAMGDQPVDARLRLSWDTLVRVSDNAQVDSFTGITTGSLPGGSSQTLSAAANLLDEKTGIRVEAGANIIPDGTSIGVTPVTSGAAYERAKNVLKNVGSKFVLFSIVLTGADGSLVQPAAPVKVSIPIPSDMDEDLVEVYLISEEGTRTFISSTVEDGLAVFYANHFSDYVLVERAETEGGAAVRDQAEPLAERGAAGSAGLPIYIWLIPIALLAIGAAVFIVRKYRTGSQR